MPQPKEVPRHAIGTADRFDGDPQPIGQVPERVAPLDGVKDPPRRRPAGNRRRRGKESGREIDHPSRIDHLLLQAVPLGEGKDGRARPPGEAVERVPRLNPIRHPSRRWGAGGKEDRGDRGRRRQRGGRRRRLRRDHSHNEGRGGRRGERRCRRQRGWRHNRGQGDRRLSRRGHPSLRPGQSQHARQQADRHQKDDHAGRYLPDPDAQAVHPHREPGHASSPSSSPRSTGRMKLNVLPTPISLSSQIRPPSASTSVLAIAMPTPVSPRPAMRGRSAR